MAMIDKPMPLYITKDTQELLYSVVGEILFRIEHCGASVEITSASSLASDLKQAIGNQWNEPDAYALQRIQKAIKKPNNTITMPDGTVLPEEMLR